MKFPPLKQKQPCAFVVAMHGILRISWGLWFLEHGDSRFVCRLDSSSRRARMVIINVDNVPNVDVFAGAEQYNSQLRGIQTLCVVASITECPLFGN